MNCYFTGYGPDCTTRLGEGLANDATMSAHPSTGFIFPVLSLLIWSLACPVGGAAENAAPEAQYSNVRRPEIPWSINVVRIPRANTAYQIQSVHADQSAVGLDTLSSQASGIDPRLGKPIAAINGDFYQRGGTYGGDPRGIQITGGEIISAPSGGASFWIDASGSPHVTNVVSLFQITWPDGKTSPFDLNGDRGWTEIEVYTPALGTSTHTSGGIDLVLESQEGSPWLPLQAGKTYKARVREARPGGSRIYPGALIVSIPARSPRSRMRFERGMEITISTATEPSLRGSRTAIGGGPILVLNGKSQRVSASYDDAYESSSMTERHPRSAVGWNDDFYFLVQVDGRQRSFSVGMTLKELAAYMVSLGCREAMTLDGGGSATLWYEGFVRNRPCDGHERMIANSLVVIKKPAAPDKR